MLQIHRLLIGLTCLLLVSQPLFSAGGAKTPRPGPTAALIEATIRGDAASVLRCLNQGADPNARLPAEQTVLHWAVQRRDLRLVRQLLDRGANVNARGIDVSEFEGYWWGRGRTPLMIAAKHGDLPIVRLLLARGADAKLKDEEGDSAFFHAVWGRHTAIVVALLKHGEDVNVRDKFGRTALHGATVLKHRDLVRVLLTRGCDVNAQDEKGYTPLMEAAANGDLPTIELLLARGADRNRKSKAGKTAWHVAHEHGAAPAARLQPGQLDPKSALNSRLMGAVVTQNAAGVRELLNAGADPNMRTDGGTTPLIAATARGLTEIVQALLERKADVNARGAYGRTALMEACAPYQGHLPVVRLLLEHGADVHAIDKLGHTAWMDAAQGGHAAILEALMAAGVDVNTRDSYSTALYRAVLFGHPEAVRVLIAHGADVNARNRDGETALERARLEHGRLPHEAEIVALLKSAGAKN